MSYDDPRDILSSSVMLNDIDALLDSESIALYRAYTSMPLVFSEIHDRTHRGRTAPKVAGKRAEDFASFKARLLRDEQKTLIW